MQHTPSQFHTDLIEITTTFPNENAAQKLLSVLLENHLVACGHITAIQSHYWWDGSTQNKVEYLVSLKTRAALFDRIEVVIKDNHPYDVPAITAVPIVAANAAYQEWVMETTASAGV